MLTSEFFSEIVLKYYSFLENKFGFKYYNCVDIPRLITVEYQKNELQVIIEYSRANYYVQVDIYNQACKVKPGMNKRDYSIDLFWLIKRSEPNFTHDQYETMMPKNLTIDESVRLTAEKFEKYGASILNCSEWLSWKEVMAQG